ncbi:MAG: hypothetical protein JWL59_387 [Chthoniobacteraceae bacterium]|nr:hypothetical protein [Chthoniobacteraceae bacterium]
MSDPQVPHANKPNEPEAVVEQSGRSSQNSAAKKRAFKQGIKFSLLLLVIVGLVMASRPLYGKLKTLHSKARASESLELTAHGKLDEALIKGKEAYILSNNEPAAIRALATVLTARGDSASAFPWWKALTILPTVSDADRIAAADAALQSGEFAEAEAQAAILLAQNPRSAEYQRLSARCKLASGDTAGALLTVKQAIELDPANPQGQLFLGALLFDSKETHQEGVRRLQALAPLKNQVGLDALMGLAADPNASSESAQSVATAIIHHPLAKLPHRLQALRLELRCRPNDKKNLLDQIQGDFASADPQVFKEFADLLLTLNEGERLLTLLPLNRAMTRVDLLEQHLNALASLRRWEEILAVLEKRNLPLPPVMSLIMQSRCESQLGNTTQARTLWTAAIRAAGTDTTLLSAMADYATRLGQYNRAQAARDRVAEIGASDPNALPSSDQMELRKRQLGNEFLATSEEIAARTKQLKTEFAPSSAETGERRKWPGSEFTADSSEIAARKKQMESSATPEEVAARKKELGIGSPRPSSGNN